MDALALLPPVDARLLAHPLEVARRSQRPPRASGAAAVPGGVLAQGPEPEAPAVVLAVRPLARVALALERVAGLEAEPASTIRATQPKNASALSTSPTRLIASAMKEPSRSQEKP